MSESVALAERNPAQSLRLVAELFTPEESATIASFLGLKSEQAERAMPAFLAFCAQWQLDPFAKQVWLMEVRGTNADGSKKLSVVCGRDGYLAIANRQPDFLGIDGDVVHAQDHFKVSFKNGKREIEHTYEQGPGVFDDEHWHKQRGPVIGAWALVNRQGREPQYYFAPLREHGKDPGTSAWSYLSAMILKSAMSMALRLSYSVTGAVPVDEMRDGPDLDVAADATLVTEDLSEVPWGTDPELADRLQAAVRRANELEPHAYTGVQLEMMLKGQTRDRLVEIVETIEEANVSREAVAASIQDAEVVPDPEPIEEPDLETMTVTQLQDLAHAAETRMGVTADINEKDRLESLARRARARAEELEAAHEGELEPEADADTPAE